MYRTEGGPCPASPPGRAVGHIARNRACEVYAHSGLATTSILPVVTDFEQRAARILRHLRPGEVTTYGEVAEEAGSPGAARAVGNLLARTDGLPWWRVVAASGRLVPGHERTQARLLRAEGVEVAGGRVRLPTTRRLGPPVGERDSNPYPRDGDTDDWASRRGRRYT